MPSRSSFTVLTRVRRKRNHTAVRKGRGVEPGGVVQLFMGFVGNKGVDINWDVSPVSSPATVLSHRVEFN